MSLLPHLCSKTTGARISRELWFGWLQDGSSCRAPGVGTGMGSLRRFSLKAASPLYDDGKSPATTSPDPPGRRVSDDASPPLPARTETRPLPDQYSPRALPEHSRETLHAPSTGHATNGARHSPHMDIDARPAREREPWLQPKHPPMTTRRSSLQQSGSDTSPSSSGNVRNRPPARHKTRDALKNFREEAPRANHSTTTNSGGMSGTGKQQDLTSIRIPHIAALNPEHMAAAGQRILNLSNRKQLIFEIQGKWARLSYSQPFISMKTNIGRAAAASKSFTPFPFGSRGFLYYRPPPPNRPEVSGALRFRVCNSLAEFDQGTDLQTPSGSAWGPSLYAIVSAPRRDWDFVVDALVRDKCVDANLVADLRVASRSVPPHHHLVDARTLYDIADPFDIRLAGPLYRLHLITRHNVGTVDLDRAFRDPSGHRPYHGLIRVRFELLPFQTPPFRTLVLRVLERLTPITCTVPDYDGTIAIPLKGGLIERRQLPKLIKHRWKNSFYKPFTIVLKKQGSSNGSAIVRTFASEQPISPEMFAR